MNVIEKAIEKQEESYEIPIWHRLGKVVAVGIAGVVASFLAERAYDKMRDRLEDDNESEDNED